VTAPLPDTASTPEPVLIAHAITVVLVALGGLGWFVIPDATINSVGDIVLILLSTVSAVVARGKVKPVNSPAGPSTWTELETVIHEIATEVARVEIDSYVATSQQ
jgi:hypothetical protein